MKQMLEKLRSLERDASSEKGEFSLFALFLREDAQDKWDLLASAPWLEANKKEGLEYLVKQVHSRLSPDELLSLSRIVVLEKGNPALESIHSAIGGTKHSIVDVQESVFSGLAIKHAYIITSERQDSDRESNPRVIKNRE